MKLKTGPNVGPRIVSSRRVDRRQLFVSNSESPLVKLARALFWRSTSGHACLCEFAIVRPGIEDVARISGPGGISNDTTDAMNFLALIAAAIGCVVGVNAQDEEQAALLDSAGHEETARPLNVAIIGTMISEPV